MKIVIFSDVHITRSSIDRIALTLRFLADCCEDADMVIILGDLFDFYHGYDNYIYPWYRSIADMLKTLAERGKRVFFVEGNHEFKMGRYFEEYTGASVVAELTLDVDGKKVFMTHGDNLSKYSLARLLKRPVFYGIMDLLGPSATWAVVTLMRPLLSRKHKGMSHAVQGIFRSFARAKLAEGYDVVILAHSHIPDAVQVEEGSRLKTYLNTGDLAQYASFAVYETSSGFSLRTWGSPEKR